MATLYTSRVSERTDERKRLSGAFSTASTTTSSTSRVGGDVCLSNSESRRRPTQCQGALTRFFLAVAEFDNGRRRRRYECADEPADDIQANFRNCCSRHFSTVRSPAAQSRVTVWSRCVLSPRI